ncbi:hypothetical protein GCM10010335_04510 [Streptomyces galbus]|nr:hypothetical protein GCM10010335_04510 [Streptomyces galbus]
MLDGGHVVRCPGQQHVDGGTKGLARAGDPVPDRYGPGGDEAEPDRFPDQQSSGFSSPTAGICAAGAVPVDRRSAPRLRAAIVDRLAFNGTIIETGTTDLALDDAAASRSATSMPPASLIGVDHLFEPDVLVEVEATALLDR